MNNLSLHTGPAGAPVRKSITWAAKAARWIAFLMTAGVGALAATIPEPDTIFYGKVLNFDHGSQLLVTSGQLNWNIRLEGNEGVSYRLTTPLELNTNGGFSYRLKVPHEALVAGLSGTDITPTAVPVGNVSTRFSQSEIRVNGELAKILPPASTTFNVSSDRRATAYRLDLEIAIPMPDSDGNGLPDWWQQKYFGRLGTDPNADPDGDGWSNRREYLAGTDPTRANTSPVIAWDLESVDEGTTELLTLRALDSDTTPDQLVYTLTQEPKGVSLRHLFGATRAGLDGKRGDRLLHAGDTFSQAQINEGRVVMAQEDPGASEVVLGLSLSDGNATRAPYQTNLVATVHTPTPIDGSGAAVWLDAREASTHSVGGGLTRWTDRSGPKLFLDGTSGSYDGTAQDTPLSMVNRGPLGQPVVGFNLSNTPFPQSLALPTPDRAPVLTSGDVTVFAVFNPAGKPTARQQLINGANFQVALAGPEDQGRANQIRFAAEGLGVVYGNHRIQDQWTLLTAQRDQNELNLEVNDGWVGGPRPLDETTLLGSDPMVGAKNTQGKISEPFHGYLAELLVFNRSLPGVERQRINAMLLSKWFGWVVVDGSDGERDVIRRVPSTGLSAEAYRTNFIPLYGPDRHYVLIGGGGRDVLQGGQNDDIIVGGRQADVISGGGGRDRFVFNYSDIHVDSDTITDFDPVDDQDVIDLSDLLRGDSRDFRDYIRLRTDGHHSYLDLDFLGTGKKTDHTIVLQNVVLRNEDRFRLWSQGSLLTGDKRFPLAATLTVARGTATEAEGDAGRINIHFTGGPAVPIGLELPFTLKGSGIRDVDYRLSVQHYDIASGAYIWAPVDGQELFVQLKPGDLDLGVRIEAIPNSKSDPVRTVEFGLTPVPEIYDAPTASATIQIVDAPLKVSVNALVRQATPGGAPGVFQILRQGSLDIPLDVTVKLAGPAVNGEDYGYIPSVLHFAPGQATLPVNITALLDENTKPTRTVELVLEAGAGYIVASDGQSATITILPSLPLITVEAYDPLAIQKDGVNGSFLLRRQGPNSATLTVLFDVSGTAVAGKDFQRFPRWVVFNPGATLALVPIVPVAGNSLKGVKTVAVNLQPDPGINLGPQRSAEVRLIAASTSFGQWKTDLFPGNSTSPESFALQDSDGDGLNNLSEYGFGFDPRTTDADKPGLPRAVLVDGRLGVRFTRPVAALDVDYQVETSLDLRTWKSSTENFDLSSSVLLDNGVEEVTLVDHGNAASQFDKRFLRVRLQLR